MDPIEFPVTVELMSGALIECCTPEELEEVLMRETGEQVVLCVGVLIGSACLLAGIYFGFGL